MDRAQREKLVRRLDARPGTRTVLVELTPDGHRAVEQAVDGLLTHEQGLIEALAPEERQELARRVMEAPAVHPGRPRTSRRRP